VPLVTVINVKFPLPSVASTCPGWPSLTSSSLTLITFSLICAELAVPDKSPPTVGSCVGIV